jgi:transcriptional regulator with XRE-family HTH domain
MNGPVKLFGRRVRRVRRRAKLTLEEASERANLSSKFVGEVELGKKRPSFEAILSLAKAFGVEPVAFFQYDGEETDPTILKRNIDAILQGFTTDELQQAYKILRAFGDK